MLSQIKLWLAGISAALFAALGIYAKYQSSEKEKYKKESELNKAKSDSAEKRIEAHEASDKIKRDVASLSDDTVDIKLHDYYRD